MRGRVQGGAAARAREKRARGLDDRIASPLEDLVRRRRPRHLREDSALGRRAREELRGLRARALVPSVDQLRSLRARRVDLARRDALALGPVDRKAGDLRSIGKGEQHRQRVAHGLRVLRGCDRLQHAERGSCLQFLPSERPARPFQTELVPRGHAASEVLPRRKPERERDFSLELTALDIRRGRCIDRQNGRESKNRRMERPHELGRIHRHGRISRPGHAEKGNRRRYGLCVPSFCPHDPAPCRSFGVRTIQPVATSVRPSIEDASPPTGEDTETGAPNEGREGQRFLGRSAACSNDSLTEPAR